MDSNFLLIIFLIVVISVLGFILWSVNQKLSNLTSKDDTNSSLLIQNQLNSLVNNFDSKLSETNRIIQDQLQSSNTRLQQQNSSNNDLLQKISENNSKILREVTEKLVKVEDTNTQIMNFAEQLQSLENILKNPKQRGIMGEYFLEMMLGNVLPKTIYKIQYPFRDGVIVDAVIFTRDKIIPIDAKFSLDGFNRIANCKDKNLMVGLERDFLRDIKMRVDETSKYVKPEENTIDMAFMFVPSDSVYQEVIRIGCEGESANDLITYAYSKKVVIVSPTSFFAYLQTLLKAMKTLQIEEQVGEIIKYLNESSRYLKTFEEEMNKLGKNITTITNSYNRANGEARKLSKRVAKVTSNQEHILNLEDVDNDME
jgi:DNA recombination protein RmuC